MFVCVSVINVMSLIIIIKMQIIIIYLCSHRKVSFVIIAMNVLIVLICVPHVMIAG